MFLGSVISFKVLPGHFVSLRVEAHHPHVSPCLCKAEKTADFGSLTHPQPQRREVPIDGRDPLTDAAFSVRRSRSIVVLNEHRAPPVLCDRPQVWPYSCRCGASLVPDNYLTTVLAVAPTWTASKGRRSLEVLGEVKFSLPEAWGVALRIATRSNTRVGRVALGEMSRRTAPR